MKGYFDTQIKPAADKLAKMLEVQQDHFVMYPPVRIKSFSPESGPEEIEVNKARPKNDTGSPAWWDRQLNNKPF